MTHHHLNVQQATGAANLCFYSDGGYKTSIVLNYGSLTHGPPGCFTQSMATFVNYIHTIKITQKFRQLETPLIIFALAVHKPAH